MTPSAANQADPVDLLNVEFMSRFPRVAARQLETMPLRDAASLLDGYPLEAVAATWARLAPGVTDKLLPMLPVDHAIAILHDMDPGPAAAILARLDDAHRDQYLERMHEGEASELRSMMEYPENTAGRMMSSRIIAFDRDMTVGEVLSQLRNQKISSLLNLFLLDDAMRLCGQVDTQRIALADSSQTLDSLAIPLRGYLSHMDPEEEVLAAFEKTRASVLPVVDVEMHLVGIIHQNEVMEAVRQDLATDLQTMVGVSKDERALSSSWFAVKKRLPWLQINLATAFLASAVVGAFEATIAQFTALAILLPIAAGQSGNTGAQALAVTMRGLTLREITTRHWLRVMRKELVAGIVNGLAIAVTCGVGVYFWSGSEGLALIIGLAMIASMSIAAVAGALVPIVLKKLGQDPAASSSIILTTITDVAGFLSFLGIATALSGMLTTG